MKSNSEYGDREDHEEDLPGGVGFGFTSSGWAPDRENCPSDPMEIGVLSPEATPLPDTYRQRLTRIIIGESGDDFCDLFLFDDTQNKSSRP